jgi:hypothetical protein
VRLARIVAQPIRLPPESPAALDGLCSSVSSVAQLIERSFFGLASLARAAINKSMTTFLSVRSEASKRTRRNDSVNTTGKLHPSLVRLTQMRDNLFVLIGVTVLASCATPYQELGTSTTGGFNSQRIAENRFAVSFVGNGFTEPKRARDYALLRAAEITLEYHYTHFTVDGQGDLSRASTVHMGSSSTTTGSISPYGTYTGFTTTTSSDMPVFKPGTKMFITCFDRIPEGQHVGRVFDAANVVATLKAKYHLT